MLENLKGDQPAMAIAIITQFNTFIQADIFKENYCLITPIILPWEKSLRCFCGLEKFIYGKK
jgi:hypothetical protein